MSTKQASEQASALKPSIVFSSTPPSANISFQDRYEIFKDEPQIRGRHSILYQGFDFHSKREVTIEVAGEDLSQKDHQHVAACWQFLSEFTHQNLLKCSDHSPEFGMGVLDHKITGQLKDEKLAPEDLPDLLRSCLQALKAIHHRGRLHGNIALDCLYRDQDGNVRIGNTPGYDEEDAELFVGRGALMAPEMVDTSWGSVGKSSDLFCLGLVLLDLIGVKTQKLFRGDQPTWAASVEELPDELFAKVPERLKSIMRTMLQKSPDQRYSDAQEILEKLTEQQQPVVQEAPTAARIDIQRSPNIRTAEDTSTERSILDQMMTQHWWVQQVKQKPWLFACATAMFLLIVYLSSMPNRTDAPTRIVRVRHYGGFQAEPTVIVDGAPLNDVRWDDDATTNISIGVSANSVSLLANGHSVEPKNILVKDGVIRGTSSNFLDFRLIPKGMTITATAERGGDPQIAVYGVDATDQQPLADAPASLFFDSAPGDYVVCVSLDGHRTHQQEFRLTASERRDIEIELQATVKLDIFCVPEPDALEINGRAPTKVPDKSGRYEIELDSNEDFHVFANKSGFDVFSKEFNGSPKPWRFLPIRLDIQKSAPSTEFSPPKGSQLFSIATVSKADGLPIRGLRMLVDGKSAPTAGNNSTPLRAYVVPGTHSVQFIDPSSEKIVYSFAQSQFFATQKYREYEIRSN